MPGPLVGGAMVAGNINSGGAAAVGGELLANETDAMGIDFTYTADITKQHYISDLTTPANNYNSYPQGKLTYTSPSVKLCRQSDGVWRYANHNLCLQSQDFSTTWSNGGSTISANATTAPDGTSTADALVSQAATVNHYRRQSSLAGSIAGSVMVVSVYAKPNGWDWIELLTCDSASFNQYYTQSFNVSTGATGTVRSATWTGSASITSAGGGWYRCQIIVNTSVNGLGFIQIGMGNSDAFASPFTGDGSSGVYFWGAQVKRYPVNDAGGYTYATGYLATTTTAKYDLPYEWNVANASQGILIEEARTNALIQSQGMISSAAWVVERTTSTSNAATAPDGTATADLLTEDGSSNTHDIYQGLGSISGARAVTVFVKPNGRTIVKISVTVGGGTDGSVFDLSGSGSVSANDSGFTGSITAEANGWYKCSVTTTLASNTYYFVIFLIASGTTTSYAGDNASGVYLWGAQLETGAFPTSPIHTIAATVTRAVDNITLAGASFPLASAAAGTMVANVDVYKAAADGELVCLDNGTIGEKHEMYYFSAGDPYYQMNDGGSNLVLLDCGTTLATSSKFGIAWNTNDFAGCYNGGTVQTDASGTLPDLTTLRFGTDQAVGQPLNGHIRQVTYLKRRATNGELQTRTT